MKDSNRGQILPLFAIMVVALFAIAAIAIDVSNAYAARRQYRTWADAAALAGAQDLQETGTRVVGATDYANALKDAQASVDGQYGTASTCTPSTTVTPPVNRWDCNFGKTLPYQFSIITPLPSAASCATCDPDRSVQVNFGNPTFSLTFSRILGFNQYSVAVTAVAGAEYPSSYAIVTLRPPSAPAIPGVRSLSVAGGTVVRVETGDVGTNANMTYSGTNSEVVLDSKLGYEVDYFDPYNGPLWYPAGPNAYPIYPRLIPDPNYPVPSPANGKPGGVDPDPANCESIAADIYSNSNYAPSVPVIDPGPPVVLDMTNITCYTPGIYDSSNYPKGVTVNNGTLAILEPGLYFFDTGLNAQGSVIGGYTPDSPGVALVFPESSGTMFKNRTSGGSSTLTQIVSLNAGDRYLDPTGQEATAALDYSGIPTNMPGAPIETTFGVLMTVIVPPDPNCPVAFPFPAVTCTKNVESKNISVDLSGGSGLYLAGIQYAPSDNISVAGNTTTGGYVGQIWAWTIQYTGGSQINQEGTATVDPATIRLDAACTTPGTPCVP